MNTLRKGDVYKAARRRFGKSEKNDWEMLSVTDDKGHNTIAVFVSNRPSGVEEGGNFRIDDISGVSVKTRKDEKGNWWTDVSVNAAVSAVKSYDEFNQSNAVTRDISSSTYDELDDSDGQLPF